MAIIPRIMYVDSVCSYVQEERQTIGVLLINRETSEEFNKLKDKGMTSIQLDRYFHNNSLDGLGQSQGSSFRHKVNHQINGIKYHKGAIITEKEALNFGYPEPYIDTLAAQIADTVINLPAVKHKSDVNSIVTRGLRDKSLITLEQVALMSGKDLHIFANENEMKDCQRRASMSIGRSYGRIDKTHSIWLMIYETGKEDVHSVGAFVYYEPLNMVYEFMTYVPVKKK